MIRIGRALWSVAKVALACAIVLGLVEVGLYLRYRRWIASGQRGDVREPEKDEELTGVPPDVIRAVGWFAHAPDRRSLLSPSPPPPGVIRIVALGDSFTYGDEVPPAYSFPALLAKRFAREGMTNVEVMNFGNSWHGFSQQYRLWDRFGRRFAPDFLLLGPACLYIERDLTFQHAGLQATAYLHGRTVLTEDGSFAFVAPEGASISDRESLYYGLFPRADYLRFDRSPPSFIRAWLPRGKTLNNPFYYTRLPPAGELSLLYRSMVADLARDDDLAVVRFPLGVKVDFDGVAGHLVETRLPPFSEFPLIRQSGHLSAIGNRLIADAFFDALSGSRTATLRWLALHPPKPAPPAATRRPFSAFRHARVEIAGVPVAVIAKRGPFDYDTPPPAVDFAAAKSVAFLIVSNGGNHPLDFDLLPLDRPIPVGARPRLELTLVDGSRQTVELDPVALLHPDLEIGIIDLPHAWHGSTRLEGTNLSTLGPPARSGVLSLEGRPLMRVVPDGTPRLLPVEGELVSAVALGDSELDPRAIPPHGSVELVLELDGGGGAARFSVGDYDWKDIRLPLEGPGLRRRIVHTSDGAVVSGR